MNYLDGKDKVIITFLTIFLAIGGIVTLRSQILYGSPIAFITGTSFRTKPKKAPEPETSNAVQYSTATVNIDALNLRPQPNTDNNPIKVLYQGARVRVISVEQGWARIIDDSGAEGYVSNDYLQY
jgi:uncharacterized protein YgiM (DUF1202 family)